MKQEGIFLNIMFAIILPFLIWNWIMGFAIYQHHTHLAVRWYSNEEEWDYWKAQIDGSVQVVFPKWLECLLHNIMDHTAHHANPSIPLYNLKGAQLQLRAFYSDRVPVIYWSRKGYLWNLKRCKLYDYETHKWHGFKV